jgi:putative transcriptional regulator
LLDFIEKLFFYGHMELPYFLVALPNLEDPLFSRSVILISEHNAEGATGFVLNHPMLQDNETLTQMVAEIRDVSGEKVLEYEELLFTGGPVQNDSIFALHDVEELSIHDTKIVDGLYLSSHAETFHRLLETDDYKHRRRFFMGVSTWQADQLDSELRSGAWFSVAYDKKFLFCELSEDEIDERWKEKYWTEVLKSGGMDPLITMTPRQGDGQTN